MGARGELSQLTAQLPAQLTTQFTSQLTSQHVMLVVVEGVMTGTA